MTTNNSDIKPVVLCILDGWGYNPDDNYNAIKLAHTPAWDNLVKDSLKTFIRTDGTAVGLPDGQMGNSEVGHTNIGAGRVIYQDLLKISKAFESNEVESFPIIKDSITTLQSNKKAIHILGLCSAGGVHSHIQHLISSAKLYAKNGIDVKLHLFTDGRDTPPFSFKDDIQYLQKELLDKYPNVKVATICGRYYAMDRDKRWERVELAYNALVSAEAKNFGTPTEALDYGYEQQRIAKASTISDEFLPPATIGNYQGMQDGDGIFMINFRSDRAREILQALLENNFNGFERKKCVKFSTVLGMVNYSKELDQVCSTVFPTNDIESTLGEVISNEGLAQLHAAETEKYPHVTFFFNGGREQEFPKEERILVASPKVATYDLQPEMSAFELTEKVLEALNSKKFAFVVINFANGDMVGHSGILEAAKKAVNAVDTCLDKLKKSCVENKYTLLVTADHGNSECMWDFKNNVPHTQHTTNPVNLIVFNPPSDENIIDLKSNGKLCDIAPTILEIMGIPKPTQMTGCSLLIKK